MITQCLRKPGVVSQLTLEELKRTCVSRGCQTLYQLQRMLRLVPPRAQRSRVELLLSRLDALGLDATATLWETEVHRHLLISEALWSRLWVARPVPAVDKNVIRQCLHAVGRLATAGIWFAAQLSAGPGRWLGLRALPALDVTESEYETLLAQLSASSHLERIASERTAMPGLRQRTLWEPGGLNKAARSTPNGAGPNPNGGDGPCGGTSVEGLTRRRRLHPWQSSPRLPDAVTFDLASDAPDLIPAPPGWELLRRNGRLLVRDPSGLTCQLDAAQAAMLELMNPGMEQPTLLSAMVRACNAQQYRDDGRASPVHWSRHLLACIARITGARGLIGCCSVTFHPHFWWYSSLDSDDEVFGSQREWPAEDCVLILDAYPPAERRALLGRAFGHAAHVWVLRMAAPGEASTRDHQSLISLKAHRFARLPKGSLAIHSGKCWSEASYDALPTKHAVEVWRIGRADPHRALLGPVEFGAALGNWENRREDFHWPAEEHPVAWDFYRESQQDASQWEWPELVAAIDGSVNRQAEAMGAGVVVGTARQPDVSFSFPVGGPLSSLRAEAAALHSLFERVEPHRPLLVFTDCLVLLVILSRWGQVDFWPDPEDVKHFDIIEPCIQLLRRRVGETRLVKVKSHSGLLMNDRADELAAQGCTNEEAPRWAGPRKLDPLKLSARDAVRETHAPFPDRNVADRQLIRCAVAGAELLAARLKGTCFSREMLRDPANCRAILHSVASLPDSTVRIWMQAVTGQYPTTARLHKMYPTKFATATCP